MTPAEVKAARLTVHLSQEDFARVIGLTGDNAAATVRSWEKGRRPCTGTAAVAIRYLLKFGPLEPPSAASSQ